MQAFTPRSMPERQPAHRQAPRQVSRDGISAKADGTRTATFVNNRPEATVLRKAQAIIAQSPQVQRLAQQKALINNSPLRIDTPLFNGIRVRLYFLYRCSQHSAQAHTTDAHRSVSAGVRAALALIPTRNSLQDV